MNVVLACADSKYSALDMNRMLFTWKMIAEV
jgi:hypothetical protein